MKISPEPAKALQQGWLGGISRSKGGTFSVLRRGQRRHALPLHELLLRERRDAEHAAHVDGVPATRGQEGA